MSRGWIKLHRKLLDSRVFANEGLLKVWIYCLCRANHEHNFVPIRTGKGTTEVEVNKGEFIFGRKSASKDLGMNPSTLYKRMQKLESIGNINTQSNTHYSIVSICNWETYQDQEKEKYQAKEQPSNNQVTGREQPSNTEKNYNNYKNDDNDKKTVYEFDEFWDDYDKKKERKKCERKWKNVNEQDRELIKAFIPVYKKHQPESQYRKNPSTFLNNEIWKDDWEYYKPKSNKNGKYQSAEDFKRDLEELEQLNEVQ